MGSSFGAICIHSRMIDDTTTCWETIFHGALIFWHVISIEALRAFALNPRFKDVCISKQP